MACSRLYLALALALTGGILEAVNGYTYNYAYNSTTCGAGLVSLPEWKELSNESAIYWPNAPEFLKAALSRNYLKSNFPAVIVYPATEADAIKVITAASKAGAHLVVRCSGHDLNDRSTGNGVVLMQTGKLTNISYDSATGIVTVPAGSTWKMIYSFLKPLGRIAVGGNGFTVCAAGCYMGGCHGYMARLHGFGVDTVVGIRFALYNGTVLELSSQQHSDLFNAVLGSGHSSYGVLLSMQINTFPALRLSVAGASFDFNKTGYKDSVLGQYFFNASFLAALPDSISWGARHNDERHGWPNKFGAEFYYAGNESVKFNNWAKRTLTRNKGFEEGSFWSYGQPSVYEYLVGTGAGERTLRSWRRNLLVTYQVPYNQTVMNTVGQAIFMDLEMLNHLDGFYGGTVQRTSKVGSMSSGMRTAAMHVAFGKRWDNPEEDQMRMSTLSQFTTPFQTMLPYTYVNLYTTWGGVYNVLNDWKTRFYSNYTQLLEVKQKYDPCNLYTVEYGVGSDKPIATCTFNATSF